jgi:hypothetical protein
LSYLLADLLSPQNLDSIRSLYLSALQGAGFPSITEWLAKGGAEMGYVNMIARAIDEQIAANIPDIVASGFLGHAAGDFMTLLAREVYLLERIPATSTTFNLQFVSSAAAPPYQLAVGDIVVAGPSGNRYTNTVAVTIPPGAVSGAVSFVAVAPGAAFVDNPTPGALGAASLQLVTAFAGLTLQPAAADFAPTVQSGSSTGQIKATRTGTLAPTPHTFVIRIDIAGNLGGAQYSVSTDGGIYLPGGLLAATQDLGGGTRLLAVAGGSSPAFLAGDTFTVVTPGGPNYVQGSDVESDANLATRCRGRWPALSLNPTKAVIYLWARLAYGAASRIGITPDPVIAGQINVLVADSHGPIDPINAAAIETYIASKLRNLLSSVRVRPATALIVTTAGIVTAPANSLATVQQAAQEAWTLYLGAIPLGGKVVVAELEQALMDAGATDVDLSTLLINGSAVNLQLGPGVVPVPDSVPLATSLEWRLI